MVKDSVMYNGRQLETGLNQFAVQFNLRQMMHFYLRRDFKVLGQVFSSPPPPTTTSITWKLIGAFLITWSRWHEQISE